MKYIYYSGCALKSSGKGYEESLLKVLSAVGVEFQELQDWNCCGATTYMSIDEFKSSALATRNLALAEQQNGSPDVQIIAPCSACYVVLNKAQHHFREDPVSAKMIGEALHSAGLTFSGEATIRHPLDILINTVGLERIKSAVRKPLKKLRVASYYGCQVVRPFTQFDDPRDPKSMDDVVKAIGAEPVDWPLKTRCCGGNLVNTIHDVGLRMNYHILREAKKRNADVLITACPLCQFNLECYQDEMEREYGESAAIPVIYFSQLMGMSFGISEKNLGVQRSVVPPVCVSKILRGEEAYA
ncbi:MAG TPA: CoB--CoM heterodisulfide reductase iron-sulfur subunit B family protein [Bacteroidota bacterium]|nr:CoB--CoM heterodisulfide reductase iron-sulfur subunit B family protein [Bacteroidota bacterium]